MSRTTRGGREAAHNILYTYVAAFEARAGLGGRVGLLLLGCGLAAGLGIAGTGLLVDRALRRLVLGSLALFGAATLALGVAGERAAVLELAVLAWGLSFVDAAILLQTAAADASGAGGDLASARWSPPPETPPSRSEASSTVSCWTSRGALPRWPEWPPSWRSWPCWWPQATGWDSRPAAAARPDNLRLIFQAYSAQSRGR